MKIEWLVADVTAVGSLDRAEGTILGVIVAGRVFDQFRSYLWSGSHFVGWEPPLEFYYLYPGSFNENRLVGNRCNSYRIPLQSGTSYFGGYFGWACFLPFQDIYLWSLSEPLCDVGTSS